MANLEHSRAQRLDQYVVQERPRLSRAFAVKLIEQGQVLVNGQQEKPGYKLRATDEVTIDFEETALDVVPEIDLPIVYEDADVLVIDKPTGVISHARGRYWDEASVASFVRHHLAREGSVAFDEQAGEGRPLRGGIVHRLDRATSGIMICAKHPEAMSWLQKQFSDRKTKKTYIAIVSGHVKPEEAIIDMPIERNPKLPSTFRVGANGKPSVTAYKVIRSTENYDELQLTPHTGRTHQLRVHLKQLGHPIVGDPLYEGGAAERLFLHAHSLEITLPSRERVTFTAPIPDAFEGLLSDDV